jgi:hypothetical protein
MRLFTSLVQIATNYRKEKSHSKVKKQKYYMEVHSRLLIVITKPKTWNFQCLKSILKCMKVHSKNFDPIVSNQRNAKRQVKVKFRGKDRREACIKFGKS